MSRAACGGHRARKVLRGCTRLAAGPADAHMGAVAEGYQVHLSGREQNAGLHGHVRVTSPNRSFGAEAATLDGRVLDRVEPYGEQLFYHFVGGSIIHVTLGQRGMLLLHRLPPPPAAEQVCLRLQSERLAVDIIEPERCELMDEADRQVLAHSMGPDPFCGDADAELALGALERSQAPIGAALVDGSIISGVGNVLRAEVLHSVGVHPERPARSLSRPELEALWGRLHSMAQRALREGRLVTADPEVVGKARSELEEAECWNVYRQARCRRCGSTVTTWTLVGRTIYACPYCQPRS